MRRVLAVIGVGAVLAFAGCGGDDQEEPAAGGAGTTTEEATPAPGGAGASADQDAPGTAASDAEGEGGDTTAGGTAAADGKQLFTNTCGSCHTLEDAGTNGEVGPNLDDLSPDKDRVLNAIQSGPGSMPDGLLEGEDAEAVAEYVSTAAGGS